MMGRWLLLVFVAVIAVQDSASVAVAQRGKSIKPDAPSARKVPKNRALRRFPKMLLKGNARGQQKALHAIRTSFLDDTEAMELLVDFLDQELPQQVKSNRVTTESLLAIESLGCGVQTETARVGLIEWCRLTLTQIDAGQIDVESSNHGNLSDVDILMHTLMMAVRNYQHHDVVEFAIPLLDHHDYRIQILALDLLGRQQQAELADRFAACAESDQFASHYAYRHALIDAVLRLDANVSRPILETMLPSLRGLLLRIVQHRLLSQRDANPADQPQELVIVNRSLRNKNNTEARPAIYRTELQSTNLTRIPYRAPRFFGVPIYADKVTFVVDLSSTMAKQLPSGITRVEQAKIELAKAINALAPNQSFRVIGFNSQVASLSPTLLPATPTNKRRFIRQLTLLQPRGGTNLYGGLVAAIQDAQQPEMIVLLSDGQPTAGEHTEPIEIIRAIDYQNLFSRIMVSTVSIGPESDLMIELASRSGGSHRRVAN